MSEQKFDPSGALRDWKHTRVAVALVIANCSAVYSVESPCRGTIEPAAGSGNRAGGSEWPNCPGSRRRHRPRCRELGQCCPARCDGAGVTERGDGAEILHRLGGSARFGRADWYRNAGLGEHTRTGGRRHAHLVDRNYSGELACVGALADRLGPHLGRGLGPYRQSRGNAD